jgi:hypothetical protein
MADYSITPYYSGRGYYDVTGADGNKYIYSPKEFVEKGFVASGTQYVNDNFLNQDLLNKASEFKLDNADAITGAAKSLYSDPTNGYVWNYNDLYPYTNDFSFGGYGISPETGAIQGIGSANGRPVYVTSTAPGQNQTVYTGGGNFTNTKIEQTGGGGLFGGFLGQVFNPILSGISGIVGGVSDAVAGLGQGVSDAIHGVGTTVAKSPILSTAAVIALTPYVGAPAAAALVSANAGAKPETIVQNMALAGIGSEIANQVAPEIAGMTESPTAGTIAGQAAGSATTAALTGRDPIQAATNALVTGGITAGTNEVLGQVDGYSDLTPTQQKAVSAAVSAELQGKDPTAALIQGAINIGKEKVQDEIKYAKYDNMDFGVNQGAVDKVAAEQAQNDLYNAIGIKQDTVKDTAPATTDVVNQLVNAGMQETPPTVQDIATIGGQPVTTSPGEEAPADLSKSGVMMPDGSYKTWAELDELAGVPPGTIYTDGGTTITQQELQDILNGTYTNPKQVPKPDAGTPKPPAPTPTPKPTPVPTTPAPTTPAPATQQNNSANMLALLSLLQPQQQPQIQQPVQGADVKLMENIFGTDFDTPRPEGAKKYSSGGEIEALLHLLRS